jgi:hypothetical protein
MDRGKFWTVIADNPDDPYWILDTFTILATGMSGNERRSIEAIATPIPPGPFAHAMYAGNFSYDPGYALVL